MNNDLAIINIILRANTDVGNAIKETNQKKYLNARDNLIKSYTLLDLIFSISTNENIIHNQQIEQLMVLQKMISNLITDLENKSNNFFNKNIKVEDKIITEKYNDSNKLSSLPQINMNFQEIIGSTEAKQALYENVILPLTLKESSKKKLFTGIRSAGGNVLLYGPPGCGKTLLIQAAASEAKAILFSIKPSSLLSKYQGESERALQRIFQQARKCEKAVIFFDEFDSIATARGQSDEGCGQSRRLLSELLLQLTYQKQNQKVRKSSNDCSINLSKIYDDKGDDEQEQGTVVVIAATNRLEDLDDAVIRRFESKIYLGVPSQLERVALIQHFIKGISHSIEEKEVIELADTLFSWSGSEIETICREASMAPLRQIFSYSQSTCQEDIDKYVSNIRPLLISDFLEAHDRLTSPINN